MKTYRDIHPAYLKNFLAFSRGARRAAEKAARKRAARSMVSAVYQMANRCGGPDGKQANVERMCKAVRTLGRRGVQLLACPEMCLQGYFTWVDGPSAKGRAATRELADDATTSPHIRQLRAAARQAKMVLAFGFAEKARKTRPKVYNSIGIIDADGRWLGSHRKNPLYPWPFETDVFDQPAKAQRVSVFKTRYATIGVTNCFDGSFPETIRGIRKAGAEVLVWCNAAVGDPKTGNGDRVATCAAYAIANNLCVVACNGAAENLSGTSCICAAATGTPQVILPPDEEALGLARLDLGPTTNWDLYRTHLCLSPARQRRRP